MKLQFTILSLLLVAMSCGTSKPLVESGEKEEPPAEFTKAAKMEELMTFLASDELRGRDSGSEGIEKAALYIEAEFRKYGLIPYFETYRDTLTNFSAVTYNMVGMVPGNDPELRDQFIIIGAHYDHIGIVKSGLQDSIANGANDNASGTSTVLELARYFGRSKSSKRSLLFVLFSAEEKGLLGSKHLASKLKAEELDLYAMLNFEMTGVPMNHNDYLVYVTGYSRSNLVEIANRIAGEELVGFLPKAAEFGLFQRSDNFPFDQEFNVPAQTFCSFDFTNFDHYHQVGDEISLMDFEHMARVVNKMLPVVEGIANSAERELKYN